MTGGSKKPIGAATDPEDELAIVRLIGYLPGVIGAGRQSQITRPSRERIGGHEGIAHESRLCLVHILKNRCQKDGFVAVAAWRGDVRQGNGYGSRCGSP